MKIHIHLSVAIFDKMLLIILTSIFVFLIYYAFVKPHRYWKERSVKHEKPWPVFGNLVSAVFQKKSLPELLREIYNKHEGER